MSRIKLRDNVFERSIRVLREEGVRRFWFKLLGEVGYRRVLLLERSLEEPIPEVKPGLPVRIELLEKTEVDKYLAFRPKADPSIVESRFRDGSRCFVARHEGQIISASWAAVRRAWVFFLTREIQLGQDEVYIHDSFTKPDFRGKSISPAIRAEMIRHFRAAGYRRVILGTEPENKSNLRAVRKVGFQTLGIMGYVKVGRWRWDFNRANKCNEGSNG